VRSGDSPWVALVLRRGSAAVTGAETLLSDAGRCGVSEHEHTRVEQCYVLEAVSRIRTGDGACGRFYLHAGRDYASAIHTATAVCF